MSYIRPKFRLSNRAIARKFVKEKERVDKVLMPIENSFCELILKKDVDYEDCLNFHLEHFNKAVNVLALHLKYSQLNRKYFYDTYKTVEK